MSVDVVVDAHAQLGECPLWSVDEQVLYWVDIEGRAVHRYDPATGIDAAHDLPVRPGSMVLTPVRGRFLMGAEHQLAWYDWRDNVFTAVRDVEPPGTGNRLNDGRTDRAGRYWVGSMYEDGTAAVSTGLLHRVDADLSSTTVREGIGVSNGIAFSLDGRTMYFADSPRELVWAYDCDLDTGHVSNERVFVDFADLPGKPDGATIDGDGAYWIACVYGWAVARITPDGAVDRIIDLPVEKPSMPSFGGANLDTLYVTSIGSGTMSRSDQPHAGALLAVDPGTTGIEEVPFAG